ncbi:hypothetical protein AXF42_Ash014971 [Apostasia shenzhenica]|uniref:Uncharacterized protein n=1 Tax=Apostasia shenzhenica TaxID=1088818 RepID=A0A2I0B2R6_9ASPA|nr:hypothetical protein AXF42_Ash014971 [Apostasia shenzhenica]
MCGGREGGLHSLTNRAKLGLRAAALHAQPAAAAGTAWVCPSRAASKDSLSGCPAVLWVQEPYARAIVGAAGAGTRGRGGVELASLVHGRPPAQPSPWHGDARDGVAASATARARWKAPARGSCWTPSRPGGYRGRNGPEVNSGRR